MKIATFKEQMNLKTYQAGRQQDIFRSVGGQQSDHFV